MYLKVVKRINCKCLHHKKEMVSKLENVTIIMDYFIHIPGICIHLQIAIAK